MLGQSPLPDEKTSLPLQFETDQAALSQKVALRRSTRFVWTGLGLAVLTLIGVSACALHPLASHASSESARLVPAGAFIPMSLLSLRGIREAGHPVSGHARTTAISAAVLEESLTASSSEPLEWQPAAGDANILQEFSTNSKLLGNEGPARTATVLQASGLMEGGTLQNKNVYELRVPELKAALKERGLPVSGKKADLITRLETNMEKNLHSVQEFTSHVKDVSHTEGSDRLAGGFNVQPLVDSSDMDRSESASLPPMHVDVQPQGLPQERYFDDLASAQERARKTELHFGDEYFNDPATAKRRASKILKRFAGESLPRAEFRVIYDMLQRHPDRVRKRVADVVRISVDSSANFPETQCFWIWRSDGSKEDISMRKCFPELDLLPHHSLFAP